MILINKYLRTFPLFRKYVYKHILWYLFIFSIISFIMTFLPNEKETEILNLVSIIYTAFFLLLAIPLFAIVISFIGSSIFTLPKLLIFRLLFSNKKNIFKKTENFINEIDFKKILKYHLMIERFLTIYIWFIIGAFLGYYIFSLVIHYEKWKMIFTIVIAMIFLSSLTIPFIPSYILHFIHVSGFEIYDKDLESEELSILVNFNDYKKIISAKRKLQINVELYNY